jgi:hypothetical protein
VTELDSRRPFFLLSTLLFLSTLVGASSALQAQTILGRVAADPDLAPVAGADIVLEGTAFRTLTDSLGEFTFEGVPSGRYVLLAQHPSYVVVRDSIQVAIPGPTDLLVVLAPDPIAMDPIEVRGITAAERRQRASAATHYVAITRAQLQEAELRGAVRASDLVWANSGLRRWVRHDLGAGGVLSGGLCLQYPRPGPRTVAAETGFGLPGCRFPAVYLDGAYMGPNALEGTSFLDNLTTEEIFSLELVPPSDAVYRYGRQAQNGALSITTMMGAAEAAARQAAFSDDQRRHMKYLGVGTAVGIFGAVGYAFGAGLFDGGVSFNGDMLPVAGIVALGIGIGELLFRRSGGDGP